MRRRKKSAPVRKRCHGGKFKIMYFDFRTFLRLACLSFLNNRKEILPPLTAKRVVFLIVFFTIFPVIQLFNAFCFLLDDIFFPEYRDMEIKAPVFIVGNPRSGTTFIHRLMSMDEEHFFFFKSWEIMFPAIIQKKALSVIGDIDRLLGGMFSSRVKRFESRRFHNFNKMHQTGLFLPEEDDKLLMHIFSSFDLVWFFPFKEVDCFSRFDQLVGPRERKRIMTFYKNCIKRQAYFKGGNRHYLSKTPYSSLKIDSLYEYFPGCKVIYMARNPLEVIPSMINMAHEIWRATIDIKVKYPLQDIIYETAKLYYNYPLARLGRAPQSSYEIINYKDLISAPGRAIQTVYRKAGLEIAPKYQKILNEEEKKSATYNSRHSYSLDQFRITREQIISDLQDIFDRFGFDTQESAKKVN